ncbi:hypothetical protein [Paenirhodobacter populi]|uniref:Uncharacterized protein n=1 Tax=Paenirhodobacter populi TaxID=2306993 RepID=A0A443J099_9RHOB|nr:hypothetical protein [Sinirhodobacter populi]RWR13792.1 hypothetical protein D2T33_05180 [Sinirhodobacter populi]
MMDTQIVAVIENDANKPETKSILTETGMRHGRLTVVRRNALGNVVLRCDCGETVRLSPNQVMDGKHYQCESCNSWDRKTPAHRIIGPSAYSSFKSRAWGAKDRCENPNHSSYGDYGGRNVRFMFDSAEDYVNCLVPHIMVYGPDGDVDRIDNSGSYEPSNIRLASKKTNSRNRRTTILVHGVPLGEVLENLGFSYAEFPSEYQRVSEKVRYAISSGRNVDDSFVEHCIKNVKEVPVRHRGPDVKKREPVMVGELRLSSFLASIGFGRNTAIHHNTRAYLSNLKKSGSPVCPESVREYVYRYATRKGIQACH